MTKKTRTILFVLIAILFFLIAPLIIFYSQGYRFDFENKKFFKTGAFSFKIWPRGAWVSIDGKIAKKATFPFGTIYIDNLLPKKYMVEIKKEGYLPWVKTLEVKEDWVIENKNIFLVPENSHFQFLEKEVENFLISPDGKKAILKQNKEERWSLTFLNLEENTSSLLFEEKDFSERNEKITSLDFKWSPDSKKFLLKIKVKENKYFVVEIGEKKNIYPLDFLKGDIVNISFFPQDSQRIFLVQNLKEEGSLFSVDYKSKEISGPILTNFMTFKDSNNNLFWLDKKGFLYQSDLSGNITRQFNRQPFSLNTASQYQLFPFAESKIFLKEGNKFYYFNEERQLLEKILEGVNDIKISPDLKKIVYFTDYEIWVLFLEKIEEQPQREKGEKIFLARFSEKIEDCFWWTNHYLIFSAGNKIKIAEIDDRDKINTYGLAEFPDVNISWNNVDKKLYILSKGSFYSSEKLLP